MKELSQFSNLCVLITSQMIGVDGDVGCVTGVGVPDGEDDEKGAWKEEWGLHSPSHEKRRLDTTYDGGVWTWKIPNLQLPPTSTSRFASSGASNGPFGMHHGLTPIRQR